MNKYAALFALTFLLSSYAYCETKLSVDKATQEILAHSQIQKNSFTPDELKLLTDAVKLRSQDMQKNLENPTVFAKSLLPNSITQKLPSSLQPYLEKEVNDIEGTLEILEALYLNQSHETTQYVLHQNNNTYFLNFIGQPPEKLQTDMHIRIKHGFQMPLTTGVSHIIVAPEDITITKNVSALPLSFGTQSVLAILVNFSDQPTTRPWTTSAVQDLIFTNMNGFYKEMSSNQTSIAGQLAGWFVVNVLSTATCDSITTNVPTLATQAATQAGIDISKYPRKIYIFPRTTSCSWIGLGTVGGSSTRAFINGYGTNLQVTSHEFGHNMGLGHAKSLINCSGSPIDASCTVSEYGDGSDTMGNIRAGHFNAFQKDRLGWVNYKVSPPITTVTQSGSYFIDAFETINSRSKALKVLKRAGENTYYYLELRQPIGYDSVLACGSACDYTQGIVFHQGDPTDYNSSRLLDMTPGTTPQTVALHPCQSWTDAGAPNGGITFTVQSISKDGARVKITYGGLVEECHRVSPTVNVIPHFTKWLSKGEKDTYKIEIKNNDNKACAARNFAISLANVPFISTTLSDSSVKIPAGKKQSVNITTQSSYTGAPFIQSVDVRMENDVNQKPIVVPLTIGLQKS